MIRCQACNWFAKMGGGQSLEHPRVALSQLREEIDAGGLHIYVHTTLAPLHTRMQALEQRLPAVAAALKAGRMEKTTKWSLPPLDTAHITIQQRGDSKDKLEMKDAVPLSKAKDAQVRKSGGKAGDAKMQQGSNFARSKTTFLSSFCSTLMRSRC